MTLWDPDVGEMVIKMELASVSCVQKAETKKREEMSLCSFASLTSPNPWHSCCSGAEAPDVHLNVRCQRRPWKFWRRENCREGSIKDLFQMKSSESILDSGCGQGLSVLPCDLQARFWSKRAVMPWEIKQPFNYQVLWYSQPGSLGHLGWNPPIMCEHCEPWGGGFHSSTGCRDWLSRVFSGPHRRCSLALSISCYACGSLWGLRRMERTSVPRDKAT